MCVPKVVNMLNICVGLLKNLCLSNYGCMMLSMLSICVALLLNHCLPMCGLLRLLQLCTLPHVYHYNYNTTGVVLNLVTYIPCLMCEFLCQPSSTRHKFLLQCELHLLLHLHSNSMCLLLYGFLLLHMNMLNMFLFWYVFYNHLMCSMLSMSQMCDPILVSTLYTCGLLL